MPKANKHAEVKPSKFKTDLCKFFASGAVCPFEGRCAFAHGTDELVSEEANLQRLQQHAVEAVAADAAVKQELDAPHGSAAESSATPGEFAAAPSTESLRVERPAAPAEDKVEAPKPLEQMPVKPGRAARTTGKGQVDGKGKAFSAGLVFSGSSCRANQYYEPAFAPWDLCNTYATSHAAPKHVVGLPNWSSAAVSQIVYNAYPDTPGAQVGDYHAARMTAHVPSPVSCLSADSHPVGASVPVATANHAVHHATTILRGSTGLTTNYFVSESRGSTAASIGMAVRRRCVISLLPKPSNAAAAASMTEGVLGPVDVSSAPSSVEVSRPAATEERKPIPRFMSRHKFVGTCAVERPIAYRHNPYSLSSRTCS